jgi:hypothetical protein
MYIVNKMTPMERARLATTSKSTAEAGMGMINNPTIIIKPKANAKSFDFSRFCSEENGFVGVVATMIEFSSSNTLGSRRLQLRSGCF